MVSGRVIDESGRPVSGVRIVVESKNAAPARAAEDDAADWRSPSQAIRSGTDGTYSLGAVAVPDSRSPVAMRLRAVGETSDDLGSVEFPIMRGARVTAPDIVARLTEPRVIACIDVVDESENPIGGASVAAFERS
jgi:hypothetical protein